MEVLIRGRRVELEPNSKPYLLKRLLADGLDTVLILALFALLILRGYDLAIHASDRYSFLVGCGITTMLALQVILNVAVCTSLVPCTGISLPFFSYGGTALMIQMAECGIVLSLSREIPAAPLVRAANPVKTRKQV